MPSRKVEKRKSCMDEVDITACKFCESNEDNEISFGKFIFSRNIRVHSNCMFFSSGLVQKGDADGDELLGFLVPDIEAEFLRGRKLFCSYCKKRGATVGCCIAACKKTYHLNCGIQNGSLQQFFDTFRSYCKLHKPKQSRLKIEDELYCYICCEPVEPDEVDSCLYSPCCKKNLFHKICLQKYALSAGIHFFKCPLCNNSELFLEEMQKFGINVPEKDASWELEENAYQELLVRPDCDASICLCPNGRDYHSQKKSDWKLITCCYCGSHARHNKCDDSIQDGKTWLCGECAAMTTKIAENKTILPIENKSDSSTLCLSPEVVPENLVFDDTLLGSDEDLCEEKTHQTSSNKSSNTFKAVEIDNSVDLLKISGKENELNLTSEISVIAGPSTNRSDNPERRNSLMPVINCSLAAESKTILPIENKIGSNNLCLSPTVLENCLVSGNNLLSSDNIFCEEKAHKISSNKSSNTFETVDFDNSDEMCEIPKKENKLNVSSEISVIAGPSTRSDDLDNLERKNFTMPAINCSLVAKNKAIFPIEKKTDSNNLCLSPKVVRENCLVSSGTLLNSDNIFCEESTHQISSNGNCNTFETVKFYNSAGMFQISEKENKLNLSSEISIITSPSTNISNNLKRKKTAISSINSFDLNDQASSFRAEQNIPQCPKTKIVKIIYKTKAKNIVNKQKGNKYSTNGNQTVITSYFGQIDKKMRL